MILDAKNIFSDAQAETTVAAHDSTNTIDTEITNANLGKGNALVINCRVNTAFTSGGSATLDVEIQDSADGSSWTTLLATEQFAVASLVAGLWIMKCGLPAEHKRYLKMVYTIGTAVMTAGAIDAWLGLD